MDLQHELLKLELEVRSSIDGIENNNIDMAIDRLLGVIEGLVELQIRLISK